MPEKNIIEITPFRENVSGSTPGGKRGSFHGAEIFPERREGTDYFAILRQELKEMQEGGVDLHFSWINIDDLSREALDLYRKYIKGQLDEKGIAAFREKTVLGDSEYHFAAMLLNWLTKRATDRRYRRYSSKDKEKAA